MKLPLFILFAFVLVFSSCEKPEASAPFSFSSITPHVIEKNGKEWFQYWEMEDGDYLWEDASGPVPALQAFRDTLRQVMGQVLLDKTKKNRYQQVALPADMDADSLDNREIVQYDFAGKTRPINVLEAEVLNYQAARYPLFSRPTEFHGFIAAHDSLQRIRFYYGASDAPWPPKPYAIRVHLDSAIQQGWHLKYHLHNHYNEDTSQYLGVLAPSKADAHYFKMLRENYSLPQALITNGYHTVVLDSADFGRFWSH